jgi:hypothetical protein
MSDYHSKDHCNYSTHKVFLGFIGRRLVAASNGGRSLSSGFPNSPRPQLQLLTSHNFSFQLTQPTTDEREKQKKMKKKERKKE